MTKNKRLLRNIKIYEKNVVFKISLLIENLILFIMIAVSCNQDSADP